MPSPRSSRSTPRSNREARMPILDLRNYVVSKAGSWYASTENYSAGLLRLASSGGEEDQPADMVTLAGPLRVCITVQARNLLSQLETRQPVAQREDLYSYLLD